MEAFMMVEPLQGNKIVVRYSRQGIGNSAVVLLHGYGQSLEVWEELAGEFGRKYDVVMVDLPGSGLSTWGEEDGVEVIEVEIMARCVSGVLEKLAITNYTVIGHSMGGYVATAMVEVEEEKVNSVVLLHAVPMAYSQERKDSVRREIEIIEGGKKEMLASSNPTKGFANENIKKFEEQIDEKIEQFMMTPDQALIATLKGLIQRKDMTKSLAEFASNKPVMMIFGESDPYINQEIRQVAIDSVPNARVEILKKSAHMGFIEEQKQVVEFIEDFIQTK